jgi:hypothetical protein
VGQVADEQAQLLGIGRAGQTVVAHPGMRVHTAASLAEIGEQDADLRGLPKRSLVPSWPAPTSWSHPRIRLRRVADPRSRNGHRAGARGCPGTEMSILDDNLAVLGRRFPHWPSAWPPHPTRPNFRPSPPARAS